MGRGPEFDDKVASREHKRAARGEPQEKKLAAKPPHVHRAHGASKKSENQDYRVAGNLMIGLKEQTCAAQNFRRASRDASMESG